MADSPILVTKITLADGEHAINATQLGGHPASYFAVGIPQYMVLGYNLVTNAKQYTMPNGVKFGPETISPSGTYRVYQDRNSNPITSEADIKAFLKVMTGSEVINYYDQQSGADSFVFMLSDKTCWKFQRNAANAATGPNQLWAWKVENFPFPTKDDIPIACSLSDLSDIFGGN